MSLLPPLLKLIPTADAVSPFPDHHLRISRSVSCSEEDLDEVSANACPFLRSLPSSVIKSLGFDELEVILLTIPRSVVSIIWCESTILLASGRVELGSTSFVSTMLSLLFLSVIIAGVVTSKRSGLRMYL